MGVAIRDLVRGKEITMQDLAGRTLIVDSFNLLYMFLTTIRGPDGTPLSDSKGSVTSHLVGLFSRVTKLMQHGIKLCFVFDGKPPELKAEEQERRAEVKYEALKKYETAAQKEDVEAMHRFAGRAARLTPEMIEEAKKLIRALGLPSVDAPSEGEAQAAAMVREGKGYAVLSQDFDSLLHGAPFIVRNLSIVGRRKRTSRLAYETVKPELISLSEVLNSLGIDNNQLIVLAMLVGTDYNVGGIKGIGPKKALELVKDHPADFEALFKAVKWGEHFSHPWTQIYYLIKKIPVTKKYRLGFSPVDSDAVVRLLVEDHDFSQERVDKTLGELAKKQKEAAAGQKGLGDFL